MDQQKCFYFNNETLSANKTPLLPDKVIIFRYQKNKVQIIYTSFLIPSPY